MTTGLGILTGRFGRVALLDMDTSLTVHAHGHCHAVFKVAGPDQSFVVDGARLPMTDETAILVNSWQEHCYPHKTGRERTVFLALYLETPWLSATDRIFKSCARPAFFGKPCIGIGPEVEFWRDRIIEMIRDGADDGAAIEQAIARLTWAISHRATSDDPRPARASDFRLRRAMHEMRSDVFSPYDYDALAAMAGLSRSRFNTLFKEATGITPAVYGNALRVEASVAALGRRDVSINHVADDLGFSAASNFCRFFQQHTGLTPNEYRRAMIPIAS